MKAISSSIILGIFLVSLLGFLGCSEGDAGTAAVPGEANPITPFGIIDTMAPTFIWTPVTGATNYRLLVQDAADEVKVDKLYTAEESGCASEEISCTVHPDIITVGEHSWKVKACADQECGLWSEPSNYDMRPTAISSSDRYVKVSYGQAVEDTLTGLTWQRFSNTYLTWPEADKYCEDLELVGSGEWHLPNLNEAYSLVSDSTCVCASFPPEDAISCTNHPLWWGLRIWTKTAYYGPGSLGDAHYLITIPGCVQTVARTSAPNTVYCVHRPN